MATNLRLVGSMLLGMACLVVLGTALSGCRSATAGNMRQRATFIFTLVDVSESTSSARERYLPDLTTIVNQLQGGDSLWAGQITENSLATSQIALELDVPEFNLFSENQDQYSKELSALKKKAHSDARALVTGRTNKTTILDSLLFAQKVFHTARALKASRRILIVLSDMREDSGLYNFDRESLTPARIKQIIKREQTDHRIPDLKGVEVYIAGASADPSGNPRAIRQIQAFWQAYFRAAGTELPDEHYSASLLDFELPGHAGN